MGRDRILVLVGLAAGVVLILLLLLYRKDAGVLRTETPGRDAPNREAAAASEIPRTDAKSVREEVLEAAAGAQDAAATERTNDVSVTSCVRILDSGGRALPDSFVLFGGERRRFDAGEDGRAIVVTDIMEGHEGAAFADGLLPCLFVLRPAEELEIQLQEDPGVELSIRWAGSGSPVTGASVRVLHCGWPDEPSAEWRQAAWHTVYGASFACDSQGAARIPGVAFTFQEDGTPGSALLVV